MVFKFANAFANRVVNVPSLNIDFKTFGRCGGMAFAALDSKLEVLHTNGASWRCFFVESYASTLPFSLETQPD
jgi:hypothetical protein